MIHLVARSRRRELAIRMALGAHANGVLALLLRQMAKVIWLGLAAGLAVSFVLGRLLTSQLHGVGSDDPWTRLWLAAALAVVSLLAVALPAHRATRADPAVVLREE